MKLTNSPSIMIADDHTLVREGLRKIIEINQLGTVVLQASNYQECVDIFNNEGKKLDLLILDVDLPAVSGFDVISYMNSNQITTPVLFITDKENLDSIMKSTDYGAKGFICKDANVNEFLEAVTSVLSGKEYFQPRLIPLLNSGLLKRDSDGNTLKLLTKREVEVLKKVAGGMMNREIALTLHISERTVKNHISSIFKKLDVADRTQAAVFAIRNNLIQIH